MHVIVCVGVGAYARVCVCMHVCIGGFTCFICMCAFMSVCICAYVFAQVCLSMCTHVHIFVQISKQ